jgi:hypothetical protein
MSNASRKDMSKDILILDQFFHTRNSSAVYDIYTSIWARRVLLINSFNIEYYYDFGDKNPMKNKPIAEEFI